MGGNFHHSARRAPQEQLILLFTIEGFGEHLSYPAIALRALQNSIAYALSRHTSERTQVRDYIVFGLLKDLLRTEWSMWLIGTQVFRTNDFLSLC